MYLNVRTIKDFDLDMTREVVRILTPEEILKEYMISHEGSGPYTVKGYGDSTVIFFYENRPVMIATFDEEQGRGQPHYAKGEPGSFLY
jgi:hypothetical protein